MSARCQVPGARCQVPDAGCQVPGARCQKLSARCQVPVFENARRNVFESSSQSPDHSIYLHANIVVRTCTYATVAKFLSLCLLWLCLSHHFRNTTRVLYFVRTVSMYFVSFCLAGHNNKFAPAQFESHITFQYPTVGANCVGNTAELNADRIYRVTLEVTATSFYEIYVINCF